MRKKESKLTTVDIIIIVFCFAGAVVSGAAFWTEYNSTLVKMNEEPVGTIIFKKRVAQRKFIDRNVWDRLKQASYIYNGDTIRTIEESDAVVIFDDKVTYLTLGESTMIRVAYDNRGGARIDLSGGNIEVASDSRNITITSGTSTIVVDGQARMEKSDEGFVLEVAEGSASFDGNGLDAGSIMAIDSSGELNTSPIISMTSFGKSASIFGTPGEAVPVTFSWNRFSFSDETYVVVEVAEDRLFSRMVDSRSVYDAASVDIPLANGSYWWRAYPASGDSAEPANRFFPSGSLEIIPVAPIILQSPPHNAELLFPAEATVPLSWSAVENAYAYHLEIASDAGMGSPAVSRRVAENSLNQTGLGFGRWYWRVTPLFPPHIKGLVNPSATGAFNVIQGKPVLALPVLTSPANNGKIPAESASVRLMWNYDSKAASWLVELADNASMTNPVVKQNASVNYLSVPVRLLQSGRKWHWRITALGGENPAVSNVWQFEAISGEEPVAGIVPEKAEPPAKPELPNLHPIYFRGNNINWELTDEKTLTDIGNLSAIAQFLCAEREYRLRIEGHANYTASPDNAEERRREHAQELLPISEMRAREIGNKLAQLGVDPAQLEIKGFGGERPVAAWDDSANWWKNRRVDFTLTGK